MMHLKERIEYEEQYDRLTVEYFRQIERVNEETIAKHSDSPERLKAAKTAVAMGMYFRRGEQWERRDEVINEWMQRDRIFDDCEAQEPYDPVYCSVCDRQMIAGLGTLETDYEEPRRSRKLYFYDCVNKEHPRKAVFADGDEKTFPPQRCSQCQSTNITDERKQQSEEVVSTCQSCGHISRLSLELHKPESSDPHFARDRKRYCMTDEEGKEYVEGKRSLEQLKVMFDEQDERKRNQHLYDAITKIEKLTIFQMETKVRTTLEELGFADVRFEKAEAGRFVTTPFSFQETKTDRTTYDGEMAAKKALKSVLAPTNWRLMSDGLSSRLGQFEGRLKGYDSEEDLLAVVAKGNTPQ